MVDPEQLKNLGLIEALTKCDAIDYDTGTLVTGDKFETIPLASRIWAPHEYK